MTNVSLERYYFVLYDGALTLKMSKMALNAFCDKTLHLLLVNRCTYHSGLWGGRAARFFTSPTTRAVEATTEGGGENGHDHFKESCYNDHDVKRKPGALFKKDSRPK